MRYFRCTRRELMNDLLAIDVADAIRDINAQGKATKTETKWANR